MKATSRKRSREQALRSAEVAKTSRAKGDDCVSSCGDQRPAKNKSKTVKQEDDGGKNRATSAASYDKAHRKDLPLENVLVVSAARKQQMKEAFQPWVVHTYGDAAKTKTISQRKAERIVRILRGEDSSNGADSSKFRFWVRAKGFRLGLPQSAAQSAKEENQQDQLYVITGTSKNENGEDVPVYKKVAVVEEFFDIIYREHVEFGGKATAKHAGQKRTFRAITEIYAFLPREAVTRFLLQCAECQRRGSGLASTTPLEPSCSSLSPVPPPSTPGLFTFGSPTPPTSPKGGHIPPVVKESRKEQRAFLPTTHLGPTGPRPWDLRVTDIDLSLPLTATLLKHAQVNGVPQKALLGLDRAEATFTCQADSTEPEDLSLPPTGPCYPSDNQSAPMTTASRTAETMVLHESSVRTSFSESNGHMDNQDEVSQGFPKDEDDEDEEDQEEKLDLQLAEPERLKAFNMFVRLFVDENLDRMVPISRQPREKVQAIIDSCVRQFPELGERARKRIRTYLKSCRRSKRPREALGGDTASCPKSIPPHLTSPAAEVILHQACENENQNAKRIRLGLEPISQTVPPAVTVHERTHSNIVSSTDLECSSEKNPAKLFRPFQGPALSPAPQLPPYNNNNNGPTDLSTKPKTAYLSSVLPHKLSPTEVLAIQQLVAGYRESAAFLLRSADELEHLVSAQHSIA